MRKIGVLLMTAATMLVIGLVAFAPVAGADEDSPSPAPSTSTSTVVEHHATTICHRTNAIVNPYVIITVDDDSVDGTEPPNGDHFAEHTGPIFDPATMGNGDDWGDIIPPTANDGFPLGHNGLNWTAEGQAILANGCVMPGTTTTTTTTTTTQPPTSTTTSPPTTTTTTATTSTSPPNTSTTTTTTPATVSPSTSSAPPPTHPSKPHTPTGSQPLAFTGLEDVVPIGAIALAMMTAGSGMLWIGSRRNRKATPPRPDL